MIIGGKSVNRIITYFAYIRAPRLIHYYVLVGGGEKQREEAVGEGVREKEWRRGMVGWTP